MRNSMETLAELQRQPRSLAKRYFLLGLAWVAISDSIAMTLPPGEWADVYLASKGLLFVVLSAVLIYGLQRRAVDRFLQSRSRLDRLERSYSRLVDNLPLPCFVVHPQHGHILEANRAATDTYGMQAPAGRIRRLADLDAAPRQALPDAPGEQLARHRRADGSDADVRLLSTRLGREEGDVDLVVCLDITAQLHEQELQRLRAGIDPLTGLPTRGVLHERISRSIRMAPDGHRMAVLFVDLDHFKLINDVQGHPAGDRHLRDIAMRIGAFADRHVSVGRFGGDEFIVVMTDLDDDDAPVRLARDIRATIAEAVCTDDFGVTGTCSIGIAWWPEHGADADTLLSAGDAALAHAKQSGRDRIVAFDPSMRRAATRYVSLVQGLRQALAAGRIRFRYQPQYCLSTGEVVGVEALSTWHEPDGSEVKASEFIPVAERSGQIVELGLLALRESLVQLGAWSRDGAYRGPIAVNVSPVQLRQPGFVDQVHASIIASGLRMDRVELEITETVALHLDEELRASLIRLAAMGVTIAIDDFGRGYSSLSHFKRLPIGKVKIDASFVRNVDRLTDSQAIVSSMLQMAASLGIGTVAEGVERIEEARWLRDHGCDAVQGYLLGRPATADRLDLARSRALDLPA